MYTAHELAAFTSVYIIAGNRDELHKRMSFPFTAHGDAHSSRTLLWFRIYNKNEELLIERIPRVFLSYRSLFIRVAFLKKIIRHDVVMKASQIFCRAWNKAHAIKTIRA